MSCSSYESWKSFGRKRSFGLEHIQLLKNMCTDSKNLLSEVLDKDQVVGTSEHPDHLLGGCSR